MIKGHSMKKYQLPDQSQVRRLFTFGCSFTDYNFDTWANILGDYYSKSEFYNYGAPGAGNVAIASKITQASILHQFNEDDLIVVCWTSFLRESRILSDQNQWANTGSVLTNKFYDIKFTKKFVNKTHYLLETLTQIHLVQSLLSGTGSRFYYLFMMHPLETESNEDRLIQSLDINPKVLTTYSTNLEYYHKIHSFETVLNSSENRKQMFLPKDEHPSPLGHGVYLNNVFDIDLDKIDFDDKIRRSKKAVETWSLKSKSKSQRHYHTFRKSDPLHPAIFH